MAALSTRDHPRRRHSLRRGLTLLLPLLVLVLVVLSSLLVAQDVEGVAAEEAEAAQEWRLGNELFDWQQSEPNSSVRVVGMGAADVDGNLYFAGVKSYLNESVDDQNLFIARLNADSSIQWTREVRGQLGRRTVSPTRSHLLPCSCQFAVWNRRAGRRQLHHDRERDHFSWR